MTGDVPILAYFRGDDGWALDAAARAVGERLRHETGTAPERWRVDGAETTPSQITERVATSPLFGGGTVAIVVDPAPLLRRRDAREALDAAIRSVAPGNALVFLGTTDAGDEKRRTAASRALESAVLAAGGEARVFAAPKEGQLAAWIEARARERGMSLAKGAAKELARRVGGFVHEGDVDRRGQGTLAVAELEKLALFRPGARITEDDVAALVSDVVPGSTWAMLDALGERRPTAAVLLDRLLDATPEPVVLVQLHRRIRELLEVAGRLADGASPGSLVRILGYLPFRVDRLVAQARRWTPAELEAALVGLLDLDAMVKSAPDAVRSERQRRLAFALWIEEAVRPTGTETGPPPPTKPHSTTTG